MCECHRQIGTNNFYFFLTLPLKLGIHICEESRRDTTVMKTNGRACDGSIENYAYLRITLKISKTLR